MQEYSTFELSSTHLLECERRLQNGSVRDLGLVGRRERTLEGGLKRQDIKSKKFLRAQPCVGWDC